MFGFEFVFPIKTSFNGLFAFLLIKPGQFVVHEILSHLSRKRKKLKKTECLYKIKGGMLNEKPDKNWSCR